jgi:hypothetical protein
MGRRARGSTGSRKSSTGSGTWQGSICQQSDLIFSFHQSLLLSERNVEHMAFPTSVNSQITDSITQTSVKVLGDAPAMAMGNLYQATAQALSNAAHNATNSQQQLNVLSQAVTTMGVSTLYSIDTAAAGIGTSEILRTGTGPASSEPKS